MKASPLAKLFILTCIIGLGPESGTLAVTPPPGGGYPNENTALGDDALFSLTTGEANTALGEDALYADTSGSLNVAVGTLALNFNTYGTSNNAVGFGALYLNTTGSQNIAMGDEALLNNTTGYANVGLGFYALQNNTIGINNVAVGAYAMGVTFLGQDEAPGSNNTAVGAQSLGMLLEGSNNTAEGYLALYNNSSGISNTANGVSALTSNTTGNYNTADGQDALSGNTTGINNTASGVDALHSNTAGNYNSACGQGALYGNTTGNNNTAVGQNAMKAATTGKNNIAIGSNAGFNLAAGSNNIMIFDRGLASDANTIRIGKVGTQKTTYIAGISGSTVAGGVTVVADSSGHLGTITSSERYKEAIAPMQDASEAIMSLHPVTFRYKKELDPKAIPQFGLVAEEVAKVDPDLVARDDEGKPYTVRYEAVNAMLLNEFLKEHREVEKLKVTVAHLQDALREQAAQVREVKDQLGASGTAPRLVSSGE